MSSRSVQKVAVIGGGITGSMASLALAQRGFDVDLIEIVPEWKGVGHGITIQGNALAAFEKVGIVDDVIAQSYPFDDIRLLDANGGLIAQVPVAHTGGEHLPSTIGSLRSSLQSILCAAVYAAGVNVRLGTSVTALDEHDEGVAATFHDGSIETFDLVVGADGIHSATRQMIGIDTKPQPSGMSIWRIGAHRPEGMTRAEVYYGGPHYKAGYSPIAADRCYAYMLDEMLDPGSFGERSRAEILYERSEGYGGIWGELRETIGEHSEVNYQWIEWLLVEEPWHRGRVVMIGDAVHACPPLIAQGAAMCAEDAVVLAEMLDAEGSLEDILTAYVARRMPRVKGVVDASLQLVEWEIHPATPGADPARVMGEALGRLVEPA